jgi:hypothetical protein
MARCSFCLKNLGFREGKVTFPNVNGLELCLDCMTCSVCGAQGQQQKGGLLGMTPLCQICYNKYNRVLPLIADKELPEETVDARLKYLYRVKDRDTRVLAQLEQREGEEGRPIKKVEDIVPDIIALTGNGFRGLSIMKVSETKSKDKITAVQEWISADLRNCIEQISGFEALKQNYNNNSSRNSDSGDNNLINRKDHEIQVIQEARSIVEALDPINNKSIDAKEFLAGKVTYLPEPYLIVRDNPPATFQNIMGLTFNNLGAVINILAESITTKFSLQHVTITRCMSSWKK